MFFRKKTAGVSWIVVFLGNPGARYAGTRHNVGFMTADAFAEKKGIRIDRLKFKALTNVCEVGGEKVFLMKPQTYMNLSGDAVGEAARFYKIPPERVIVLFDDISLDVGRMRIRRKGSDGGHNGIKSIIAALGSADFPRIKIGVGAKPHPDYDLADWVLTPFDKDQLKTLRTVAEHCCDALRLMVAGNIDEAMSRCNS